MITVAKRFRFHAGHRLRAHAGKCRNVHGHTYEVEVEVASATELELDADGFVVDFGELDERFGGWIRETLDHVFIAERGDPIVEFLRAEGTRFYVMDSTPTAENLAELLHGIARERLAWGRGLSVVRVTVRETPTSEATFRP
jgi:6-pyruvoyltetrahydropterin/6-carboxytetrahydropterin synthase